MRRLQRYGVTKPELERYQMALLRDAEQAAEQSTSIPSVEMLEYSMDSIGLEHTVMDQAQVSLFQKLRLCRQWFLCNLTRTKHHSLLARSLG